MNLWNIPAWAWATGIAIGFAISIMMFDNLIVAAIFAVSIGTTFAIAFSSARKADSEIRETTASDTTP